MVGEGKLGLHSGGTSTKVAKARGGLLCVNSHLLFIAVAETPATVLMFYRCKYRPNPKKTTISQDNKGKDVKVQVDANLRLPAPNTTTTREESSVISKQIIGKQRHQHVVTSTCRPPWSPMRNPHSPLVMGEMSS